MSGVSKTEERLKGSLRLVLYAHDTVSGETREVIVVDTTDVLIRRDLKEIEVTLYNPKER